MDTLNLLITLKEKRPVCIQFRLYATAETMRRGLLSFSSHAKDSYKGLVERRVQGISLELKDRHLLFFYKGNIGAGLVSHEIYHCIIDTLRKKKISTDSETGAYFTEVLNREFWIWYQGGHKTRYTEYTIYQ